MHSNFLWPIIATAVTALLFLTYCLLKRHVKKHYPPRRTGEMPPKLFERFFLMLLAVFSLLLSCICWGGVLAENMWFGITIALAVFVLGLSAWVFTLAKREKNSPPPDPRDNWWRDSLRSVIEGPAVHLRRPRPILRQVTVGCFHDSNGFTEDEMREFVDKVHSIKTHN